MADDTYPEELYVDEIEWYDYDDFFYWDNFGIPEGDEWQGDFWVEDVELSAEDSEYWGEQDEDQRDY